MLKYRTRYLFYVLFLILIRQDCYSHFARCIRCRTSDKGYDKTICQTRYTVTSYQLLPANKRNWANLVDIRGLQSVLRVLALQAIVTRPKTGAELYTTDKMKTRSIAFLMGMTALAAAAEPSMNGQAHAEDGSAEPEAAPPIGILIMAQGRSGSTMVGEFFRQNKVCQVRTRYLVRFTRRFSPRAV